VRLEEFSRNGEPVTSCVIECDSRTREDREAAQARATAASHRETDIAVLKAIRDHDVTSQRALRDYVGLGYEIVMRSLSRVLQEGWATRPRRQRDPYALTDAGKALL
jgi:hypothetical protein